MPRVKKPQLKVLTLTLKVTLLHRLERLLTQKEKKLYLKGTLLTQRAVPLMPKRLTLMLKVILL